MDWGLGSHFGAEEVHDGGRLVKEHKTYTGNARVVVGRAWSLRIR